MNKARYLEEIYKIEGGYEKKTCGNYYYYNITIICVIM